MGAGSAVSEQAFVLSSNLRYNTNHPLVNRLDFELQLALIFRSIEHGFPLSRHLLLPVAQPSQHLAPRLSLVALPSAQLAAATKSSEDG